MADPMQVAIKVAASGLQAQSRRMLVVSENLANANSTGNTPGADPYTRKTVSFESHLDDATGAALVNADRIDRDSKPFRIEHDPSHPAADADGNVKMPNVDSLVELEVTVPGGVGVHVELQLHPKFPAGAVPIQA